MKINRLFLAAALCVMPLSSAYASSSGQAPITFVHVHKDGQVIFEQGGARNGAPTCATINNRWAFDATTAAGQAKLALILSMYTSGKTVSVQGTGSCEVWGDTETVDFVGAPI